MGAYRVTIPFQTEAAVYVTVEAADEAEAVERAHEEALGSTVTVTFDPDFVDHDAVTTQAVAEPESGETVSMDEAMRLMGG